MRRWETIRKSLLRLPDLYRFIHSSDEHVIEEN
jgi:hypothetical protein